MGSTRPGYVAPGQSVDEAYRKWGYKLRRKRASKRSSAQGFKQQAIKLDMTCKVWDIT